ncbi:MAG TPA: DinB family protein [Candidatus Krumholzibacteria bacterium]|nr:DinB family protein [Candidatus Krumholzibacteria bacterium]
MSASPLPSKVAALRDELNDATSRLHRLLDTVDESTWGRSPAPGKWSAARCVEHLNLTSRAYLPLFRAAFKDARARGLVAKNPTYELDFWGWLLIKSFESRLRMKTPDSFVPPTIEPKDKVLREYDDLQNELSALLVENGDLALGKIKIVSPFNASITYHVYSAYRIIPSHQRRHLAQAERVLMTLATQSR